MSRRMTWKGTALLLPLIFIIGCSATNKQPLSIGDPGFFIGDPGRWVDSDGHGITWASTPSGKSGHFVKYTDGPYKGKVYQTHRDGQHKNYLQRDGKKVYVYLSGSYLIIQVVWWASDGYTMEWALPPPGMSGDERYVEYSGGPYRGQVYQVHRDGQGKSYIQRDGEKVYVHRGDSPSNED